MAAARSLVAEGAVQRENGADFTLRRELPAVAISTRNRKANSGLAGPGIEHGNAEVVGAFPQGVGDEETAIEDRISRKPLTFRGTTLTRTERSV